MDGCSSSSCKAAPKLMAVMFPWWEQRSTENLGLLYCTWIEWRPLRSNCRIQSAAGCKRGCCYCCSEDNIPLRVWVYQKGGGRERKDTNVRCFYIHREEKEGEAEISKFKCFIIVSDPQWQLRMLMMEKFKSAPNNTHHHSLWIFFPGWVGEWGARTLWPLCRMAVLLVLQLLSSHSAAMSAASIALSCSRSYFL